MGEKSKSRRGPKKSSNKQGVSWKAVSTVVAAIVIVLAGFILLKGSGKSTSAFPAEISVAEAFQKGANGAFFLDVREPSEWEQFHLPGSIFIPLGELANRINELPRDREIIVVCRTGHRSSKGRDILLNAGFQNVTSMAGGLTAWRDAGYPTEAGQ